VPDIAIGIANSWPKN